nr:reverse transcriptase domain-containing protein [Tanacetum cinerariifolium]
LWLGFEALTGEATGSMIGEITGSEFRIGNSIGTTGGWTSSAEESGVDEPELGKLELNKLVLDKLEDTMHPTNNESTEDVHPPVVPIEFPILNSEPVISPIIEPVASPVSASKPNQRPLIPYPSRFQNQKLRDKANDQREKFFQIFKDLNFNISFTDALILMPKFGPSIKSLLTNKDKLCELARTP